MGEQSTSGVLGPSSLLYFFTSAKLEESSKNLLRSCPGPRTKLERDHVLPQLQLKIY
jgi:hypothetical protein